MLLLSYSDYYLNLQAEEATEARRFTTAKLTITVRPVDASPPVVEASADEGEVEENSPKGTKVLDKDGKPIQLTISDPDLVSTILYKIYTFNSIIDQE